MTRIDSVQHDATNHSSAESADGEGAGKTPPDRRRHWLALGLLLLAGAVIYLPALRSPYLLDDYLHASMIDGTFPVKRSPFDLYNFVDDVDRAALVDRGMLPWWSDPRLTIRFFRPLSSVLLWADHRLLGNSPLPLHVHSFLWWMAAVLAARALFQRAFTRRVAWLATIIFALAPCHVLPLTWLANREALISLTFGTLALTAYLRWRKLRRPRDGALAAVLFAVAMLGGEYAVCIGGYIVAFELVTRAEGLARRGAGVLPFAAPAAAYLFVRAKLRYGAIGSGFYADPFRETSMFLRLAPRRLVTLLADLWLSLDNETLNVETPAWLLALLALTVVALLFVPLRHTFAQLADERRGTATWLLLGSVLALIPVLAVVPSPRLLGASLLGVAPVVALLLDRAWFVDVPPERRGAAELTGLVALALGFAHLVHAPGTSWLMGRHFNGIATSFATSTAELRKRLADPARAEMVVIRGMAGSFFLPFALQEHGVAPARWRILAQTGHALVLRRDARTLDLVVPVGQSVFPTGSGYLFRDEHRRVAVGDRFTVPGLRVTVLEVGAQGPRVVRLVFDRDLESPPFVWITEDHDGYTDAPPPPIGMGKPLDP